MAVRVTDTDIGAMDDKLSMVICSSSCDPVLLKTLFDVFKTDEIDRFHLAEKVAVVAVMSIVVPNTHPSPMCRLWLI